MKEVTKDEFYDFILMFEITIVVLYTVNSLKLFNSNGITIAKIQETNKVELYYIQKF